MVSEDMLRAVGPAVSGTMSLLITRKGAMTLEAYDAIDAAISDGATFDSVASQLSQKYNTAYWRADLEYTRVAARRDEILKAAYKANSYQGFNTGQDLTIDIPLSFDTIDGKVRVWISNVGIKQVNM
jgi:hypothetical protein